MWHAYFQVTFIDYERLTVTRKFEKIYMSLRLPCEKCCGSLLG